jgi:GDP-L-fucose synthase
MPNPPEVVWDTTKPSGDKIRLMDTSRAESIGIKPEISIEEGVKEVMAWYQANKAIVNNRYNVFQQGTEVRA